MVLSGFNFLYQSIDNWEHALFSVKPIMIPGWASEILHQCLIDRSLNLSHYL